MALVPVNTFLKKWESSQSITDAVDSNVIYTESPFNNLKGKMVSNKTEFKMPLNVTEDGRGISEAVPLFDRSEVQTMLNDKDTEYVHIGALIFGIEALFKVDQDLEVYCFIVDRRRTDLESAIIGSSKLNMGMGRAAFCVRPNFSVAKEDLEDCMSISAIVYARNLRMRAGFRPFALSGGAIYRCTNTSFARSKLKKHSACSVDDLLQSEILELSDLSDESVNSLREDVERKVPLLAYPDEKDYIPRRGLFRTKPSITRRTYGKHRKVDQIRSDLGRRLLSIKDGPSNSQGIEGGSSGDDGHNVLRELQINRGEQGPRGTGNAVPSRIHIRDGSDQGSERESQVGELGLRVRDFQL
uniref:MP n=1 Tax=Agave betaflexivirus 1 TaxID=2794400 RepID=A0A7T5UG51_9VIRU|nr:MP [Agave betaflexivirus 1]